MTNRADLESGAPSFGSRVTERWRVEERVASIGGTRVRYLEAGKEHEGTPLLMLHGFQAGADYWFPHPLPRFSRTLHVIAPDLPGFGDSTPLREPTLDAYAAFVVEFLDELSLGQVDLLGHSLGAQIAIAAAASSPRRFRRLVLVDSAGLPQSGPRWHAPMRMLTDASTRHFRLYPLMLRLAARSSAMREELLILQHQHVEGMLKKVAAPTLVVWGSRDRIVPLEHGAFMARHIPNARLAIIRGAGHMPFYHKPDQFSRLVLAFLTDKPKEGETGSSNGKH